MSGMSQSPVVLNENTVPISIEATNIICQYPLGKVRSCIPIQEYVNYKNNWNFFDTVWSYNYTISTLNSTSDRVFTPYKFLSNGEIVSYSNGQAAHIEFYSNVSSTVFKNIF
jgi:hypothetical protein